MSENLLNIIGVLLVVTVPVIGFLYWRKKRLKKYFRIIWRKSSALRPKDLLELRPYHPVYHKRDEDGKILQALSNRKNVLILGSPLSGKTRAVYEALTKLNKACDVLIARAVDIDLERFLFPKHLKLWRPKVLVVDDLHRFVELQNFEHIFRAADENHTAIIATCRSGLECDKAKAKIGERSLDFDTLFGENVFELGKVSEGEAKKVAKQAGKDWAEVKFDGTIGSVFMRLSEMETRFDQCHDVEKTILRTLRKLYVCGIYEENQVFPLPWVRTAGKTAGLHGKEFEWTGWFERLKEKEFITLEKAQLRVEEVYLEDVVKPEVQISNLHLFDEMITVFADYPDALVRLGNRALKTGWFDLEISKYLEIAIKAYNEALKIYAPGRYPTAYAMTQNNLGATFGTLAEIVDKTANCKKAVKAFEETLKVYTIERFPIDYALTQNNLGIAYRKLAEAKKQTKAENCKKAIEAFEGALKVNTLGRFPMAYAMTQNNLGNAYGTLAEIEDMIPNCKKAIGAYEEALKVYTIDLFPRQYAMTQNNLGCAYRLLAEAEDKVENSRRAISACKEALKIRSVDRFPRNYAETQCNLGNAYQTLAESKDKAGNCKRAKIAYEEALKVYTENDFPQIHQVVLGNLAKLLELCKIK